MRMHPEHPLERDGVSVILPSTIERISDEAA
jgi:hypothetical protein